MSLGGASTNTNWNQNSQSQTQQQQQQQQTAQNSQQSTATSTPNLPDWYNSFLQSVPGQYSNLNQIGMSLMKPVYGQQQQANFQNNLNRSAGAASQALQSQLASRGMLNSAVGNQMQTQLALGNTGQLSNYLAQVPQLNQQNAQQVLGQLGNLTANAQNFKIPYGTTTNQSSLENSIANMLANMNSSTSSSSSGNQDTQQSSNLLSSLLGGLTGGLTSMLTGGLGSLLGGGSFGSGASQAVGVGPSGGGGSFTPYSQGNSFQVPQMSPTYIPQAPEMNPYANFGINSPYFGSSYPGMPSF